MRLFRLLLMALFVSSSNTLFALEWERIIDDGDEGYSETSEYNAWRTWQYPLGYGGDWRYLSGYYEEGLNVPRRGKAIWATQVPVTGWYEVAFHLFNTENRTTDADYFIEDGLGETHHFVKNQKALPTGWHILGTFQWNANQLSTIVLDGTDDNGSDEADAIRWVLKQEGGGPVTPEPEDPDLSEWVKIIDDGDVGYSDTSEYDSWRTWSYHEGYNGDWRYLSGHYDSGSSPVPREGKAFWTTEIPVRGLYEVSFHLYRTDNRTTDADYFIEDGLGETHHIVRNQKVLPTGWHLLGTFEWDAGQSSTVVLDGTDDNGSDEADAMRWVLVEKYGEPDRSGLAAIMAILLLD